MGERPVARACSPAASSTSSSGWAAVDGHEPPPPSRQRRAQRDPEAHRRDLAVQHPDARGQARRADRDVPHVDGLRARLGEDPDGPDHPLDVGERLPHPLEEDPVDASASGQVRAERPHLLDFDLPRLQVAREAHAASGAEGARERAPDLRADARGEPSLPLQRDAHRLDDRAVGQAEGVLDEGIDRARAPLDLLDPGDVADRTSRVEGAPADGGRRALGEATRAVDERDDAPRVHEVDAGGQGELARQDGLEGAQEHEAPTIAEPGPGGGR